MFVTLHFLFSCNFICNCSWHSNFVKKNNPSHLGSLFWSWCWYCESLLAVWEPDYKLTADGFAGSDRWITFRLLLHRSLHCCPAPLQNLQWWKIQWRPKIGHVRQKISSEGAENRPIVFRWIPALLFIAALGLVALGSTIFWFVPFSAFWSFQHFARWLTSMNFYLTTRDVISGSWSTVQGRDGWRINELGRSLLK